MLIRYLHWCNFSTGLGLAVNLRKFPLTALIYAALHETDYLQARAGLCVDCTAWEFALQTLHSLSFLLICYLHWCGLTVNLLLTALCHRLIYCTQLRTLRSILIYGYAALDETAYLQAYAGLCVDCTAWEFALLTPFTLRFLLICYLHCATFAQLAVNLREFPLTAFCGVAGNGFIRTSR